MWMPSTTHPNDTFASSEEWAVIYVKRWTWHKCGRWCRCRCGPTSASNHPETHCTTKLPLFECHCIWYLCFLLEPHKALGNLSKSRKMGASKSNSRLPKAQLDPLRSVQQVHEEEKRLSSFCVRLYTFKMSDTLQNIRFSWFICLAPQLTTQSPSHHACCHLGCRYSTVLQLSLQSINCMKLRSWYPWRAMC